MSDIETYTETAIEHAAAALLWQASDSSEDGGEGFPVWDDDDGNLGGATEFIPRVIEEVPYLAEAVTAFVAANWNVLTQAHVSAEQCGHDIILTANHHGAGFWDRGLPDVQLADGTWRNAGDYLTEATRGYSFEADFQLDEDGEVVWLCVENTVLADELGLATDPADDVADAAQLSRTESSACDR